MNVHPQNFFNPNNSFMVHFDHLKCSIWFWKIPSIQNLMSTDSQRLSADISYGFENINHKNMYEKYWNVELENLIKWYSRSHNGDVDDTNFFSILFRMAFAFLLLKLNQTRSSAVHKLILFDLIFLPTPSIATSTSAATTAAAAIAAPTLITERSYWCSRLSETCS